MNRNVASVMIIAIAIVVMCCFSMIVGAVLHHDISAFMVPILLVPAGVAIICFFYLIWSETRDMRWK